METDIYKKLKAAQEFSLTIMRQQLEDYLGQIIFTLLELKHEPTKLIELDKGQLIDLILKEFYESLLIWKGRMLETLIYPKGKHPLRFIGNKERFYDEYLNKITKFASDYNSFYKSEARFLNQEAFRMIKKLARLYELTDIYKK